MRKRFERRKFPGLLLAFGLLFLSPGQQAATPKSESKDVVAVELFFKETGNRPHKFKVPVGPNAKDAELAGGGFATFDDYTCKLTCDYEFLATAFAAGESKSRLSLKLSVNGKYSACGDEREMTVTRGQKSRLKLKCGVKVLAYYEPSSGNVD